MSERHTLHPLYMVVGLFSIIKGLLPILIITLFNRRGEDWSGLPWYGYAGIVGIVLLFMLILFLQWRRFGFWLEEDRIIIRKGLLFRDEKTIFYSRIHSVNVEQPLIHRLFRVAQVKIETPGGKKSEGTLEALSLMSANAIKEHLRSRAKAKETEGAADPVAVTDVDPSTVTAADTVVEVDVVADGPVDLKEKVVHVDRESGNHAGRQSTAYSKEAVFRLDTVQLLQAAATSMNFGLVAAFFAGLYSFADNFIEMLLPERFFETVVEDSSSYMPSYIFVVILIILVLMFAWLFSILLYILKFSGFTVKRDGRQIALSYGLLEKKTYLFDPKKVQAVILKEGLLRQPFGFVEVMLQVVTSDKNEQLMLHPFIKRDQIDLLLSDFVPQLKVPSSDGFAIAPRRAFLYYFRFELLLSIMVCTALILLFKEAALPSLLLLPLVIWWRKSCHRAAGMKLEDGQLTLRRRFISRMTYYIRRPQILTMKVKRSVGQQRKGLLSLSVQAMGSTFNNQVSCLDRKDVEPVWQWYSRRNK